MNNIIQFLIGFRLPDIGYWNFLPRHFTSLLYLGEIYRTLSEVTLKKNVERGNAIQSVRCVTSTQLGLIRHEMKCYTAVKFLWPSHRTSDTFSTLLSVAHCVTRTWRQNFQTFLSSPFIITFKPHPTPHKLLQYDTMFFSHIRTVQLHLDIINVTYSPTNAQVIVLKTILKFTLK
jgi:hypothetical protein